MSKNAKVNLDFPDTDLLAVIKYFSEATGRNFIVQERLAKAKITIMSPVPVTIDEAWRTFLTLLSVNNISVVQDGKFLIIMNEKDTISQGISVVKEDDIPNVFKMVATILKFKYVSAQEMDKVVKIFSDKGGASLIFDDKTMILVDYAANIKKILELTRDLDMPLDADTARLHFIRLTHIVPSDAKKLIDDIFKDFTKAGGKQQKKAGETPVLGGVANDGQPQQSAAPAEGQPQPTDEGGASTISSMYVQIVADDRNEQLIILSNKTTFELVLQVVKKIDRDIEGEGEIHVLKLQNAKAKDLVTTLNTLAKGGKQQNKGAGKGTEVFEGEVNISANEATNSLVIVSSLRDFRNLKKVVEQLDIRRKQVFVEAVIMEVKVSESLEYGTSFAAAGFETSVGGEKVPVFFGKAFTTPTPGLVAGLLGPVVSGTESMPGISPIAGIPSLGVLWNAMKNDGNVNVMSAPHILTTDNEEAEIVVGDTIPFPSGNIISGTAGSQITYKREDVALKLKIKPQINESGYMTLNVDQEVTELGPMTDYGFTTSKRAAKTIINAEDEQTVVIGGLMKDIVTESENKIPILGDIPLLGALFKYTKNKKEKVNLLIILTPHIVEGKEDFERIYKRKMRERDEFAKKFYGSISDYERSVTIEKKRGALLAMARLLDQDKRREEEEKERIERMNRKRAFMVGPDGSQKEIDLGRKPDGVSSEEPSKGGDAAPMPEGAVAPEPAAEPSMEPEPRIDAAEDSLVPPSETVPPIEETR
ncbi:MAG TPA: type II secretion system secretin GspD [bacterium]|nr:type II secretion system secretin GspD [bacterium]